MPSLYQVSFATVRCTYLVMRARVLIFVGLISELSICVESCGKAVETLVSGYFSQRKYGVL